MRMNRNDRIRRGLATVRETIVNRKQWREVEVGGIKMGIDLYLLGPREMDAIREALAEIEQEVITTRK